MPSGRSPTTISIWRRASNSDRSSGRGNRSLAGDVSIRTRSEPPMPKASLLFTLSLVIAATAGAVLETAGRAAAQNRHSAPQSDRRRTPPRSRVAEHELAQHQPAGDAGVATRPSRAAQLLGFHLLQLHQHRAVAGGLRPPSTAAWGSPSIGVHTPEFPPYAGEHDKGNVERALGEVPYRCIPTRRTTIPAPGTCTASDTGPASCSSTRRARPLRRGGRVPRRRCDVPALGRTDS